MISTAFLTMLLLAQAEVPAAEGLLTLEQALRETETNNLDLQAARARLDQANQMTWKAWSYYLPQVTAGATLTRNNKAVVIPFPVGYYVRDTGTPQGPPASAETGIQTNYVASIPASTMDITMVERQQLAAQLQVNQAIIAPAAWFAISSAYAGEQVAALGTEAARREILFGAAQLYYGAAGLKQALAVQERQLSIQRDHERDAQVRYRAGTTPKVALLRAEIDRARAEQDLKRAQNAYASAKLSLGTLIGRTGDFDVAVPPEQAVSQDPSALEQGALRDRPDVKAAAESVRLAERLRNGNYAQYLPNLGAFAQYRWVDLASTSGISSSWAIGLALNWTLFDGGLREANLRENRAKVVEAEANRKNSEAKAVDEVKRTLLDLDSARANKAKAAEQVSLARENAKLVQVSYKAGAATYLEVADANAALLSAELGQVAENLNAEVAAIRLLKAAGAFNPK
jgi:outer membrane protein TolC